MACNCEFCKIKSIFYSTIKDRELDEFCSNRIEKDFEPGDQIIMQGEAINSFIYLKEGLVKLYRDTPSGRQIISLGKPFDFVSLLSVFGRDQYSYSVSALSNCTVCILSMSEIKQLIHENGDFAMRLISTMSIASENILYGYLNLSQKRLNGRVASVLLYFADEFHSSQFELPISRKEIAQLIGMTTENVIRTISNLRRDKILKVYGKSIEILDKDFLHKIKDLS